MADVQLQIFQSMIEKNIFPDNAFYKNSKNAGNSNANTITIPQSSGLEEPVLGAVTAGYNTTANNMTTATALTPVINVNDQLSYPNVILRLPHPIVMETLQETDKPYNKAAIMAADQAQNINTAVANYAATQFMQDAAQYIIGTTGKDKAGNVSSRASAVTSKGGIATNVNRFGYEDLLLLEMMIKKQSIENGSWYALITPEIWDDMRRIENLIDYEKTGQSGMLEKGIVGKWGLINWLMPRQNSRWEANALYDITNINAPVPVAYGGTLNTNCTSAIIAWNDQFVERNEGGVEFFSTKKDPFYMGDVYNWGVRFGAAKRRADGRGVVGVYESPVGTGGVV
jgi:hypothetical protein